MLITGRLRSVPPPEKETDFILRKSEALAVHAQVVGKFGSGHEDEGSTFERPPV
jgi:hypothetical protein